MSPSPLRRKLVIVGDGACGKTCLLTVFIHREFPVHCIPTVFENHVADTEYDGKQSKCLSIRTRVQLLQ